MFSQRRLGCGMEGGVGERWTASLSLVSLASFAFVSAHVIKKWKLGRQFFNAFAQGRVNTEQHEETKTDYKCTLHSTTLLKVSRLPSSLPLPRKSITHKDGGIARSLCQNTHFLYKKNISCG